MEKDLTYFEELITKYLCNEANPAEISELSAWLKGNPGNERIFIEYRSAWMAAEEVRVSESVDLDAEWKIFEKHVAGFGISAGRDNTGNIDRRNVRVIPLYHLLLRVAAIIVLLAIPSFFIYRYLQQPAMKELAARDSRMQSLLPDGSTVTLNKGALIRYPEKFKGNKRAVNLEGEAYFDVAHNAAKPFIISTDGIRVEVKGTSFYINTRSLNGDFELVLTSGKVELYFENQPGQVRTLDPGDKAIVKGNQIIICPNQDANYMAWKTRKITFSNDPLNHVAATLSKVYQTDIRLGNPSLSNCRLTASFDNQSLESVLNVLKATLDLDIRNSGSLVEISGKGCR